MNVVVAASSARAGAVTVVLVTQHVKASFLPLALLYLKAELVEHRGLPESRVGILELESDETVESAVARILARSPDVVGFSCYVWNVSVLLRVAAELKRQRPSVQVVLGGPEVGPEADDVLARAPYVDVVVRGEGETPFGDLVDAWRAGMGPDRVAGVAFRVGEALGRTPDAEIRLDLDSLASPHQDRYLTADRRIASVETQRGCVFRCNFCFYNKDLSIRNRRFDLDRVKDEILFWLRRRPLSLFLMDPVFNLNAKRAKEICRFIAAHNEQRVPIHAEVWAEFIDDELAALMAAAGFRYVEVGLQTTDEVALESVERRLRMEPFLLGLGHLARHGIPYELQLIYGLPSETPQSFRRSLDFCGRLAPPRLSIFMLMVLPGTELRRRAKAFGLEFDPAPPYYVRRHPGMTDVEIGRGALLIEGLSAFRGTGVLQLVQRWPGLRLSTFLDDWAEWSETRSRAGQSLDPPAFARHFAQKRAIPRPFLEPVLSGDFSPESPNL